MSEHRCGCGDPVHDVSVVDATAYANAIASFVAAVGDEIKAVRERDAALARLEAVRALCDEAEGTTWAVPMVSTQRLRAAIEEPT